MPDTRLTIKLTHKQRDEIVAILDGAGDNALQVFVKPDKLDSMQKYADRCFHLSGLLSTNVVKKTKR